MSGPLCLVGHCRGGTGWGRERRFPRRLLHALLRRRGVPRRAQLACLAVWLFSPFTVTISTRGNGEALVSCMLLAMLLCLDSGEAPRPLGGPAGTQPERLGTGMHTRGDFSFPASAK